MASFDLLCLFGCLFEFVKSGVYYQDPICIRGAVGKEEQWYQESYFIVLNLQINGPTRKFAMLKENNSHEKY